MKLALRIVPLSLILLGGLSASARPYQPLRLKDRAADLLRLVRESTIWPGASAPREDWKLGVIRKVVSNSDQPLNREDYANLAAFVEKGDQYLTRSEQKAVGAALVKSGLKSAAPSASSISAWSGAGGVLLRVGSAVEVTIGRGAAARQHRALVHETDVTVNGESRPGAVRLLLVKNGKLRTYLVNFETSSNRLKVLQVDEPGLR